MKALKPQSFEPEILYPKKPRMGLLDQLVQDGIEVETATIESVQFTEDGVLMVEANLENEIGDPRIIRYKVA